MKKLTLTIVAFLGLFVGAMAQTATHQVDITINSVAMIRAVSEEAGTATNSAFTVGAPTTAGAMPITTFAGGSLFLQYTSIKALTGTPRTIKAALTTGIIPAGLTFSATAITPIGTGAVGVTNDKQTISPTAATMIKNIGSGYTGIDMFNGANVYYTTEMTAMASLKVTAATTLTVTYTLSSE